MTLYNGVVFSRIEITKVLAKIVVATLPHRQRPEWTELTFPENVTSHYNISIFLSSTCRPFFSMLNILIKCLYVLFYLR